LRSVPSGLESFSVQGLKVAIEAADYNPVQTV
jgi:hypothetical protein